jgi:putative membrane protein
VAGVVRALSVAVVALQIPYPLVHGDARNVLTVVTVVVFAAASVAHAVSSYGLRYAATLVAVVGVGGLLVEVVGVHTGLPFGRYRYLDGLGASLWGVPLVIPLAWVMMAHPARTVANRLTSSPAALVVVAAVALASWDVFLDPQMVTAGHWRWSDVRPHLAGVGDVPLSDFAGWLAVSLVLMLVLYALTRKAHARARDDTAPVALWLWTWLSSTLANLAFFHRPAVAAWGFVAMGVVGVPLLRRVVAAG